MIIRAYFSDGTALVAPLDQVAQLLGVSEERIKSMLDGKNVVPDPILVVLPRTATWRLPTKVPKIKER